MLHLLAHGLLGTVLHDHAMISGLLILLLLPLFSIRHALLFLASILIPGPGIASGGEDWGLDVGAGAAVVSAVFVDEGVR